MTNPQDLRSGDAQKVANAGYKLTPFNPNMPEAWFVIVEADMAARAITDDNDKFAKVLSALGVENTHRLQNELSEIPSTGKFEWIKEVIKTEFATTIEDQFDRAFSSITIAPISEDELPSKLMQKMLTNMSAEMKKSREFKILFIRQMPADIRPLVASYDEKDPKKFAILCDKALANYKANKPAGVFNVNVRKQINYSQNESTDQGRSCYAYDAGQPGAESNLADEVAQLRFEVNHLRRGQRGRGGFRSRGRGRISSVVQDGAQ